MDFKGQTVLITGGASGIGMLCGQCYARDGANVALVDIDAEGLERVCAEIDQPAVMGIPADVTDYRQVTEVCDQVMARFGAIDILINCAGGAEARLKQASGTFPDIPIDVYDFGVDLNLKGPLYFDHAVMRRMAVQNHGVIIHLGSIVGQEGCATNVAYSAAKAALMNGMTKSIAQAGSPYHIRCVCVAPGPVLTRAAMAGMRTMVGRAAQPQEIVDMIQYVTSQQGAFINGTTLLIDGGRDAMRRGEPL